MPCASTGVSPAACAHGMKPFIGFETGAGASLSVVHWAVVADETLADRVAPTSCGRRESDGDASTCSHREGPLSHKCCGWGRDAAWARRVGPECIASSLGVGEASTAVE